MKKPIVSKKEHSLYIETARQRIAEVLFMHPDKEFSLSDLAKEAKVKKSNIGTILEEFEKNGMIEITRLSKIWRIKANQKNTDFIASKSVYNLSCIYDSKIINILIGHFKNPKSIILFGSFRKGEDISSSDIDIAIEIYDTSKYQIVSLSELSTLEKKLGKKIHLHLFNRTNIDLNLFNNIANGIVLWGFLEVKK
jgi:predicted nucleotidyltransferase